jgi:hypothetical protein
VNPDSTSAGVRRSPRRAVRGFVAAGTLLSLLTLPLVANADPSQESPAPSGTATSAPDETETAAPTPTPLASGVESDSPSSPSVPAAPADPSTSAGTPDASPTSGATPRATTGAGRAAAGESSAISLAVTAAATPVAGHYFEDIGRFAITGSVGADSVGATVTVYRRAGAGTAWSKAADATSDAAGAFSLSVPVTERGAFTFAATIGGSPTAATAVVSNQVGVTVENSYVSLNKLVGSIDSLKNPTVAGRVVPARAGVKIIVEVLKSGAYVQTATATTTAAGTYATTTAYGRGHLASYQVRTRYVTANRPTRSEASTAYPFKRIAVTNAVLTGTTAAEVAKTYRAGCPVGRSKLKTITINFYGFDKLMHRGVIIVRKDLTTRVVRGFSSALAHRYPIAKMNNPNVYGGNDPKQMAADNTSGFNCRKVVGNPYKMSPHSYGIAIDVNTVRNPYRDSKGKWWPANGKKYVKRTPKKWGMLTKNSYLTKSLSKDKFFWGGRWSPGKDYQHFEYRG